MKNILLPTDFSAYANYAQKAACVIARKSGASLDFLHSVFTLEWPQLKPGEEANYPELKAEIDNAEEQLNTMTNTALEEGIDASRHLAYNQGYRDIIDHINKHENDFVIMGSHGAHGAEEFFIGSNAQRIIRLSPVPVLTIKQDPGDFEIKDIVFASDFNRDYVKPFQYIKRFAELFGATIHLLYVNTPNKFEETPVTEQRINAFIKDTALKGREYTVNIFNSKEEGKGVLDFAGAINADVVSLLTAGRTGFAHLISGSMAEEVANHADLPVLTLNYSKAVADKE